DVLVVPAVELACTDPERMADAPHARTCARAKTLHGHGSKTDRRTLDRGRRLSDRDGGPALPDRAGSAARTVSHDRLDRIPAPAPRAHRHADRTDRTARPENARPGPPRSGPVQSRNRNRLRRRA